MITHIEYRSKDRQRYASVRRLDALTYRRCRYVVERMRQRRRGFGYIRRANVLVRRLVDAEAWAREWVR